MRIFIGKCSGFCIGVRKAIYRISGELSRREKPLIYGEIIHNPQTVSVLKSRGLEKISNIDSIDGRRVAIRSHGIPLTELRKINRKASQTINLTCSKVARVQGIIKRFASDGYFTVILGDKNHAEVESLKSYALSGYVIISRLEELKKLPKLEKMILVSQTTLNTDFFSSCKKYLINNRYNIKIFNTICDSTQNRQNELINRINCGITKVVVIGGKNSGNTKRLAEISESADIRTFLIESSDELKSSDFEIRDNIFITAGASTPSWIINDVIDRMYYIKNTSGNLIMKFMFLLNIFADKLFLFELISGIILMHCATAFFNAKYDLILYLMLGLLFAFSSFIFSLTENSNIPDMKRHRFYFLVNNRLISSLVFIVISAACAFSLWKTGYGNRSAGYLTPILVIPFPLFYMLTDSKQFFSGKLSGTVFSRSVLKSFYLAFLIAMFSGSESMIFERTAFLICMFTTFFLKDSVVDLIRFERDIIAGNNTVFVLFGRRQVMAFFLLFTVFLVIISMVSFLGALRFLSVIIALNFIFILMTALLCGISYLYEFRFRLLSNYLLIIAGVFGFFVI